MRSAIRPGIQGVVFDVDGTFYHQWPLRLMVTGLLVAAHGQRPRHLCRVAAVIRAYRRAQEALRDGASWRRSASESADLDLAQRTAAARLAGEPIGFVTAVVREWFQRRPLLLPLVRRRTLMATLRTLVAGGLRLGVYSDYSAQDKLAVLGIDGFFPVVMSACQPQIGAFKPSPAGFLATAEAMGLPPRQVLYVGDRASVDGVGATCAGMQVVIVSAGFKVGNRCPFAVIKQLHHLPLMLKLPSAASAR